MGRINRLDQNMINMIAAGEVIERPASVIKELMENSIDAGATNIAVVVEDGGRKSLRVTDNGMGMDAEDLDKAFEAHATSKIHTREDLVAIGTLGFRGEALASVSSVAQIKAVTRSVDSDTAHCLEIDCGQRSDIVPCGGPVGTTIDVRDLFYKLPARRKFLRTAQTEMGHITEQFLRIALGTMVFDEAKQQRVSSLALSLTHNNREVYRLAAGEDLFQRVTKLFPMLEIRQAEDLIVTDSENRGVRVQGLLGHPSLARGNSKFQYVFLNGRFIRDKTVTHAIKEAYRGLLEPNRFPVVFLFLEMPLTDYDVNVHPTKTEVRFYQSQLVHSQVKAGVREQLLGTNMNVQGHLPGASPRGSGVDTGEVSLRQGTIQDAMAAFFQSQRPRLDTPRVASPAPRYSSLPSKPVAMQLDSMVKPSALEPMTPSPTVRRFLQIHDSYILAETDEGFMVVDQHALHEKVLFEQFCRGVCESGLEAQRLLVPPTVLLSDAQAQRLDEQQDLLKKLGVEVVPFGTKTYAIQTFPQKLQKVDPVDFVQQLVDLLDAEQGSDPDRVLDAVLSMAACKAAIKAHNALSRMEIEQLLVDGEIAESSSRCPHGRPTTIRFTLVELEKQFLRT